MTRGASPTAHTTLGSDAFATTARSGWLAHRARQDSAMLRTSPKRSSWSRVRLPSTSSSARSGSRTFGTQRSSTSSTATSASRSRPSAAATPAGMLAPVWLLTVVCPQARSASLRSRVVVVFPLVAETIATRRAPVTSASRSGAMASMTRPLTWVPAPRPVTRDAHPAARPTVNAARARGVSGVTPSRTSTRRRGTGWGCGPDRRCRDGPRPGRGPRRARPPARSRAGPRRGSPTGTGRRPRRRS